MNKLQFDTDKKPRRKDGSCLQKIPKTIGLITSSMLNIKFTEIENKIPSTAGFKKTDVTGIMTKTETKRH